MKISRVVFQDLKEEVYTWANTIVDQNGQRP